MSLPTFDQMVADEPMLKFFKYAHLPDKLRRTSEPFAVLALAMVSEQERTPERTVGLRKLLEAKDCFVRNSL